MESQADLTKEQEARRRDGLRMLARIIARQFIDRAAGCAADDGQLMQEGQGPRTAPITKDGPTSASEEK